MLDKAGIDRLIPHAGSMCLLDEVQQWDSERIVCISTSHFDSANPMLDDGRLGAAALVEYGAQAAAVHAGLIDAGIGDGRTALIGAIKALKIIRREVDPGVEVLVVAAQCVLNSNDGAIYQIEVGAADAPVIRARVVMLIPEP